MSWFRLKACPKCHGDLASDDGDWLCLQCGTYYYTGLYSYTGINRAKSPTPQLDVSGEPNGHLALEDEQSRRDVTECPPKRMDKALACGMGVSMDMAGPSIKAAAYGAALVVSVETAMRHQ